MKVKDLGNSKFLVVLDKGDSIMESFKCFYKDYANNGVCHVEGIGAVETPVVGYLKHDKQYLFKALAGEWEVLAVKGNITLLNNEPMVHLHVVLSDIEMKCFGGHLKDALVSVTLECFVNVFPHTVERKLDQETGINLISI